MNNVSKIKDRFQSNGPILTWKPPRANAEQCQFSNDQMKLRVPFLQESEARRRRVSGSQARRASWRNNSAATCLREDDMRYAAVVENPRVLWQSHFRVTLPSPES